MRGGRGQGTSYKLQGAGDKVQGTGYKLQGAGFKLGVAHNVQLTLCNLHPNTDLSCF